MRPDLYSIKFRYDLNVLTSVEFKNLVMRILTLAKGLQSIRLREPTIRVGNA